jgi:NAD(P) transhydrogenase
MTHENEFDVVVIGSGPAGLSAATEAARVGLRVAVVEREATVGGACLHRGTIPSKTLREAAVRAVFRRRFGGDTNAAKPIENETVELQPLLAHVGAVLEAHTRRIREELSEHHIASIRGRASFVDANTLSIDAVSGKKQELKAGCVVIATGSFPRHPAGIEVDHENVLDSDSLLAMTYLPSSLAVLGGGIIASEYASIFALLGTQVTLVDPSPAPMRFLDTEIARRFCDAFTAIGGRIVQGKKFSQASWDGLSVTRITLDDGNVVEANKVLVAAGRIAGVRGLGIEKIGLAVNERGLLTVDDRYRTAIPHILAIGDVVGPPALASSAALQGRIAIRRHLELPVDAASTLVPVGIYTVPEISSVGLTAEQAKKDGLTVTVGDSRMETSSRGLIAEHGPGLLRLVAEKGSRRLLGVHIIGETATELVHIGQMALIARATVDVFIDNVFNYPTLAEAYRLAALDVIAQWDRETERP